MVYSTLKFEQELWATGLSFVCGLDEVGRGCFAGPVVVGCVIFPKDVVLPQGLADSKLLTPKKREQLAVQIKELALDYSISEISVEDINKVGIGEATQMAFRKAVKSLKNFPEYCLIDAFFIKELDRRMQKPIIGGDKVCASISAASIIAKVYRDELMRELHKKYPQYSWDKNKGYGTKDHREAIKQHGLSKIHRTSFKLEKFLE